LEQRGVDNRKEENICGEDQSKHCSVKTEEVLCEKGRGLRWMKEGQRMRGTEVGTLTYTTMW
jgi:hypothetical protein